MLGGAEGDRTPDLLTVSFQLSIVFIEFKGLTPGTERHIAAKKRNFRNLNTTGANSP